MATTKLGERSEVALIAGAANGDKAAFMHLIKMHDDAARAVAYAVTMNRTVMDDVLQESYLKAFRSLRNVKADTNFRAWLCRIVRNTAIDEFRKQRKIVHMDDALMAQEPGKERSIEDSVTNTTAVAQALAQLPEQQRIAIRLVDAEQLPYAEVAAILDLPIGTVSSRVNAARATLRSLLTSFNSEDEQR